MSINPSSDEDQTFLEFRRKVRDAELLSAAMERLLRSLQFSGRLMVVVQNGQVLKSGYEEGYFRRRNEKPLKPSPGWRVAHPSPRVAHPFARLWRRVGN
jgi:hypothetical protein